jgi:CheY-like chemotaxis protein/HPt (histidine-containing phosphotransfer) domain-containing protein
MDTSSSDQLKVLVVDDDELNQRMMRLILTREGHDVHIAVNGLDAIKAVAAQEFDIILMDLQMPVMDGIEASRRIRESINGDSNAYIVALTASYLPEKGHELFEAGIDNYIAKPFDVDHLRQMLDYGLDRRKARRNSIPSRADVVTTPGWRGFDATDGIRMVGGDVETFCELLADFVEKLPEKTEGIERCFAEKDMDGLSRIAHNIKGVSSNLGALQLNEYAGKLEKSASEGYTSSSLESIVREIREISQNFIVDASNFLNSAPDRLNNSQI